MTRLEAEIMLNGAKNHTSWFDGSCTLEEMHNMLRYRMQFGEAETAVIISALVLQGAVFTEGRK